MTKSINEDNRHLIWMNGRCYDFNIVSTSLVLSPSDYATLPGGNPVRHQKQQIVLHCTAANGTAENTINGWIGSCDTASAHFVLERTAAGQCARPPLAKDADVQDINLCDVVRVMDDDTVTYHATIVNGASIGIEITNAANEWKFTNTANEPTLQSNPRLPSDHNRYIHIPGPAGPNPYGGGTFNIQAFEDQQYSELALLLRYLCITHRIPRRFFGDTTTEVFKNWLRITNVDQRRQNRLRMFQFRGILHHRNVDNKLCPGVLHRNRIYRGLIDEWWLPFSFDGSIRNYYSGPFVQPPYSNGSQKKMFFSSGNNGVLTGTTYRDANVDHLTESKSYYDLSATNSYYSDVETVNGGHFPISISAVWHGGIHIEPKASNPCIYCAASGHIVAARVTNNTDTLNNTEYGSQCFILVRHTAYVDSETDPDGVGSRIKYSGKPIYIFTLYMHLKQIENIAVEHDQNPPWFNLWRRNNPSTNVGLSNNKGIVFAPNIDVSVGDILGHAGKFGGRTLIHFEVLTHRDTELSMDPWTNADIRFFDDTEDVICDSKMLTDILNKEFILTEEEMVDLASRMRNAKAFHKSEWALSSADQLQGVVDSETERKEMWTHIQRFTWIPEAIAANSSIETHLCSADGKMWHYHPYTFMHFINNLILAENRELSENEDHSTNVEIDDNFFFTNFLSWDNASNSFVAASADTALLHPCFMTTRVLKETKNQTADTYNYGFHFNRENIVCKPCADAARSAVPPAALPQRTKVSVALVEILERIRAKFDATINVNLAYICNIHTSQLTACIMNTGASADNNNALARHAAGVAIDFSPASSTPAACVKLWNTTKAIVDGYNQLLSSVTHSATQADLPLGYTNLHYRTFPDTVQNKLTCNPQQTLTTSEARSFEIHMEFTEL